MTPFDRLWLLFNIVTTITTVLAIFVSYLSIRYTKKRSCDRVISIVVSVLVIMANIASCVLSWVYFRAELSRLHGFNITLLTVSNVGNLVEVNDVLSTFYQDREEDS